MLLGKGFLTLMLYTQSESLLQGERLCRQKVGHLLEELKPKARANSALDDILYHGPEEGVHHIHQTRVSPSIEAGKRVRSLYDINPEFELHLHTTHESAGASPIRTTSCFGLIENVCSRS
jgi:hypothetical protein